MANFNPITVKGHSLFEVSSAFQKSIRRGDELQAIYWALELYKSNYAEYAWKRLLLMTGEDIGLADPQASVMVQANYATWSHFKSVAKKDGAGEQPAIHPFMLAVLYCVRAQKSRIVDNILIYYGRFWQDDVRSMQFIEIPDYAMDKHTHGGKRAGKGFANFMYESTHLENKGLPELDEHYERLAKRTIKFYQAGNVAKGFFEKFKVPEDLDQFDNEPDGITDDNSLWESGVTAPAPVSASASPRPRVVKKGEPELPIQEPDEE